ncbi:gluconate 2-dehydrogenase subunit 3 family protein [Sphingobium sp. AP50]|uniref:gluconate 2-dehydrogenase subunit 3 family protein n=1 Tax=Sphingobium sp. AP50 TaxID=1884369 RepID=UPI00210B3877|nr:gluconate 2-dehydrogenase subunit 3 family protein [Sphingobium sp. AP50]
MMLTGFVLTPALSTLAGCLTRKTSISPVDREAHFVAISDVVIPRTTTAGAVEASVPAYLSMLWDQGILSIYVDDLIHALMERSVGCFPALGVRQRSALIADIDRRSYSTANGIGSSVEVGWRELKGAILAGYYTSQAGAEKELFYELIPGRFDPDITIGPLDRAWANDWRALLVS